MHNCLGSAMVMNGEPARLLIPNSERLGRKGDVVVSDLLCRGLESPQKGLSSEK